jgi:hypothetical protein
MLFGRPPFWHAKNMLQVCNAAMQGDFRLDDPNVKISAEGLILLIGVADSASKTLHIATTMCGF